MSLVKKSILMPAGQLVRGVREHHDRAAVWIAAFLLFAIACVAFVKTTAEIGGQGLPTSEDPAAWASFSG